LVKTTVDGGLDSERCSTDGFNDTYRTSMNRGRSKTNGVAAAAASTQRRGAVLGEGKTRCDDLP
jgi:hypothetical protein